MSPEQTKAIARAKAISRAKAAVAAGPEVVKVTDDGTVYRQPDGSLAFQGPSYSTNDPARIQQIMEGATGGEASTSGINQSIIDEAPVAARAQEFARGMPFVGSYTDELAGAIGGPDKARVARATTDAMQAEHPGQTLALNAAGTIAGAVPLAAAAGPEIASAAPTSRWGQAVLGAGLGTTLGATEGAVYQYGEDRDALKGAMVGGVVGGVTGVAAPYVNAGLKRVAEFIKGSDVAAIATEMGISKEAATVIRNAFRSADPDQARASVNAAGEGAMLADAGQGAAELLDASAAAGGQAGTIARRAVDDRASASAGELDAALTRSLGAPQGQKTATSAMRQATSSERGALYSKAYSQPIDYAAPSGRFMENLLARVPQSAINTANELMKVKGVQSKQILAEVADDGTVKYFRKPDTEQIHYIMQALSDTAEGATGKLGRKTTKSGAYEKLRSDIGTLLKRANPEFAAAQKAGADTIRQEQAVDTGYKFLTSGFRREDAVDALKNYKPGPERDALKQGVRSYIDDALANVKRTITDPNTDAREAMKVVKDLSSRANREKLTRILGKDAKKLFDAVDKEAIALELRAAIATNSKTAIRQSIQQGVKDQTSPGIVRTLAQGEPLQATRRLTQALTGETAEAQQIREMGLFEEIAAVLTQTRGKGAERALQTIQAAIQGQPIAEAQANQIARVLTATGVLTANRQASTALTK